MIERLSAVRENTWFMACRALLVSVLASCMGPSEDYRGREAANDGGLSPMPDASSAVDAAVDAGISEHDAGTQVRDAGSEHDSGTVDRDSGFAGSDAGRPPSDAGTFTDAGSRIPIFLAQGMVGRTTISCDDGRTWVADRSWDNEGDPLLCGRTTPIQCFATGSTCQWAWYNGMCGTAQTPCDCGHSTGFSKGVAFDGTHFVATWGWGYPGSVRRSRNGVEWTRSMEGQPGFGGIAYGNGMFVTGDRAPKVSLDGITWDAGGPANFSAPTEPIIWSVRRFAFSPFGTEGRFVAVASGTNRDVLISSNRGQSWWRPQTLPPECGRDVGAYGDIVGGNGVIVMVGSNRVACRSTDGGNTWTMEALPDDIYSSGLWTGSEFWFWSPTKRWSSRDGTHWTSTNTTPAIRVGPVARSPSGTLVAVSNVWNGYSTQEFLRSTDGISWQRLPKTSFSGSHPIFFITWGLAERSAVCP